MKNISIIGSSSHLGVEVIKHLDDYNLFLGTSQNCNVCSQASIDSYFNMENLYGLVYCSALKSDACALQNCNILQNLMEVNLFGAIRCLQKSLEKGVKKIVVIGSVDGTFGNYSKTMYAVSKAALHEYVRCLAVQVKNDVEVICVVPGTIKTSQDSQAVASYIQCFMDDKIKNVHGQLIRIDGGHHTFPI